jgi:hypothetical protein
VTFRKRQENVNVIVHYHIPEKLISLSMKMLDSLHDYRSLVWVERLPCRMKAPSDKVDRVSDPPMREFAAVDFEII